MKKTVTKSYFLYVKHRDILDSMKFSTLKNKTENKTVFQILKNYAKLILMEKRNIVNILSNRLDWLTDFAYKRMSKYDILTELKKMGARKFVDGMAFDQTVFQILSTYQQMFSSIQYHSNKREQKDSIKKVWMREFLVGLWFETKEEMISYLEKKNPEKFHFIIDQLKRDKTLFPTIHKIQMAWIKRKSSFLPKSLTFQTINDLHGSLDFIKKLDDKRIIISLNIPNVGVFRFVSKWNKKYFGEISDFPDTKTTINQKTGLPNKSRQTYSLKFMENGSIRISIFKKVFVEKSKIEKLPPKEKIVGIDLNSRDNRSILSDGKTFPVDKFLVQKEKKLEESLELHSKNCKKRKLSTVHGKQLRLQEAKQERRQKYNKEKHASEVIKYLKERGYEMLVCEDLHVNATRGYKAKMEIHDDTKVKHVQRALCMDDMKNQFIKFGQKYGISVAWVNSRYTSQECSNCHQIESNNRNGAEYKCSCGFSGNADLNAAINIRNRMTNDKKREKLQYWSVKDSMWKGRNYKNKADFLIA